MPEPALESRCTPSHSAPIGQPFDSPQHPPLHGSHLAARCTSACRLSREQVDRVRALDLVGFRYSWSDSSVPSWKQPGIDGPFLVSSSVATDFAGLPQRCGETAIPHGRLPARTLAVTRPACRSTMETSSELPLAV